jgi:hypothetical protein
MAHKVGRRGRIGFRIPTTNLICFISYWTDSLSFIYLFCLKSFKTYMKQLPVKTLSRILKLRFANLYFYQPKLWKICQIFMDVWQNQVPGLSITAESQTQSCWRLWREEAHRHQGSSLSFWCDWRLLEYKLYATGRQSQANFACGSGQLRAKPLVFCKHAARTIIWLKK